MAMEYDTGPGATGASDAEEATAMGERLGTGEPSGTGEPRVREESLTGEPLATGEPPATGEPRVDAALSRLGELDELPLPDHPAVYESIHEELVEVLGDLHPGQVSTAGSPADQAADRGPADNGSAGTSAG
jgi:hypothetical protein